MAFFLRNTTDTIQQWQALCGKVHQLMQVSKYDRALHMLETMLEQASISTDLSDAQLDVLYQYYSECLVQDGRLEEALEILYQGIKLQPEADNRCRDTLEELVIPAIEKHIREGSSPQTALQLILALETVSKETARTAIEDFLSLAGEAYRRRDFTAAASAYESIIPLAEQHGCLDFEDILRAGDCCVKCNQLNKAWKLYKSAQAFADTYSRTCRLHKKIADLLVIRNQDWHAVFHFLIALQAVPSDKGARTKLQKTLKKLGMEQHINRFLQLNSTHSDHKQLEISLMDLRKRLKAS